MRICFTSDLHGDPLLYDQLDDLLRSDTPDLLILGGDLFADGQAADPVGSQIAQVTREFVPRVERWRAASHDLVVACLSGNHDWVPTREALRELHGSGLIVLLDEELPWRHRGVEFVGYACTPPTPHTVKDYERLDMPGDGHPQFSGAVWDAARNQPRDADLAEHFSRQPTMKEEMDALPAARDPWILVAHAPPFATRLDRLPGLTYPIGSRAVREFIEQRQPTCTLHGHIHEAPHVSGNYTDRIGRTLCINPGQSHDRLHAVLFDTRDPAGTLRHTVLP